MILKKISFIIVLIFLFRQITSSQEVKFTPKENQRIKSEINTLLGKYEKCAIFSKDGINIDPTLVNEFRGLFSNSNINVYNNLDLVRPLEQNISVNDYIHKVESYYKGGLEIKLNWNIEQLSNPFNVLYTKNKYQVFLPVEIRLLGLYKGNRINNSKDSLYFVFKLKRTKKDYQILKFMLYKK